MMKEFVGVVEVTWSAASSGKSPIGSCPESLSSVRYYVLEKNVADEPGIVSGCGP